MKVHAKVPVLFCIMAIMLLTAYATEDVMIETEVPQEYTEMVEEEQETQAGSESDDEGYGDEEYGVEETDDDETDHTDPFADDPIVYAEDIASDCKHVFDNDGICTKCGEQSRYSGWYNREDQESTPSQEEVPNSCRHSFDDHGECTKCGYQCTHPKWYEEFWIGGTNYYIGEPTAIEVYSVTDYTHRVRVADLDGQRVCAVCGYYECYPIIAESNYVYTGPHQFYGSDADYGGEFCWICGYKYRELKFNRTSSEFDTVTFGTYEQDGDTANGAEMIEWYVLDEQSGYSLLLSKYALEWMYFNAQGSLAFYQQSTLRRWLNFNFYEEAFTDDERSAVSDQTGLNGVFLLSLNEVQQYLPSMTDRTAVPTAYAIAKGANKWDGGGSWWWVCDTYEDDDIIVARGVTGNGSLDRNGQAEDHNRRAVRPAIWVKTAYLDTDDTGDK